ncbi:hypothetical protein P9112_004593 [Eukaryota sp. TZLM1-RC]
MVVESLDTLSFLDRKSLAVLLDHFYDARLNKTDIDLELVAKNAPDSVLSTVVPVLTSLLEHFETEAPPESQVLDMLLEAKLEIKTAKVIAAFYRAHHGDYSAALLEPFRFRDSLQSFSWRIDIEGDNPIAKVQFKVREAVSDSIDAVTASLDVETIDHISKKLNAFGEDLN